jgi:integrase
VHSFYAFHLSNGAGPLVNPVPGTAQRRLLLAHRSPLEPLPPVRRVALRQKVPARQPRSVPDAMWAELAGAMRCTRDRALLACYVASGARASELLALRAEDISWQKMVLQLPRKGSDVLTAVRCRPRRPCCWPRTCVRPARRRPERRSGGLAAERPGR